jgi:hypothetical protein
MSSTAPGKGASLVGYVVPSTSVATTVKAFLDSLWATGTNAGAKLIRWVQGGSGAVPQTVEKKLRRIIHVEDFGAVGDGVVDDTAAFIAARDYLASIGGGTCLLDAPSYKITETIQVTQNNIMFRGKGSSDSHDDGPNVPGTEIRWAGVANGIMFDFTPAATAVQRGHGGGLVDVALHGNISANTGLMVRSWRHGLFRVYGAALLRTIVEVRCVDWPLESQDTQFNQFWIYGRQTAGGLGGTLIIDGGDVTAANTSFNTFHEINSTYNSNDCLTIVNSDSNNFGLVRLNTVVGSTAVGVNFVGSNVSTSRRARANQFLMLSPGSGGVKSLGTSVYTYPARSNKIVWLDLGNGSPEPAIGAGSTLQYTTHSQVSFDSAFDGGAVFARLLDDAVAQRDLKGTESIRIHNDSSNHIRLATAASEWGIRLSSGNLDFVRSSGTGNMSLSGAAEFRAQRLTATGTPAAVSAGEVQIGGATSTTVGSAGGAAALPATPTGYWHVNVGGTTRKIPYYNS